MHKEVESRSVSAWDCRWGLPTDRGTFGSGVQFDYGGNYIVYTFVKTHHTVHTGTINTA